MEVTYDSGKPCWTVLFLIIVEDKYNHYSLGLEDFLGGLNARVKVYPFEDEAFFDIYLIHIALPKFCQKITKVNTKKALIKLIPFKR